MTVKTVEARGDASTGAGTRWLLVDSWTIASRHLAHIRYMPEKLIDVTIQPIMFVFMFAYIFGSAINVPGGNYKDFLMSGIFTQNMVFASMPIMVGIVNDMQKGVMDRFRSLPISRAPVLIGHVGANLVENLLGLAIAAACGLIVGWRGHLGLLETLGGFGLLLLFGFAMTWVGVYIGLFIRSVEAAQSVGFVVLFPLTFVANTFVPTRGMPGPLRTFANWNPISTVVAACRHLFGDPSALGTAHVWPLMHPVLATLVWCGFLIVLFLPLAVRKFKMTTSQ